MTAKWLELARKEIGTKEWAGRASNPTVEQYYLDAVGTKHTDEVAWCAAWVGAMLVRAGERGSGSLMARSYLAPWGLHLAEPIPGAIVIFPRGKPWQGHVGIVEKVTTTHVVVISGNQNDAVTRKTYRRSAALDFRWPATRKALRMAAAIGDIGMTPEQIMAKSRALYEQLDTIGYDVKAIRKLAKEAVSLSFYLAKLHVQGKGLKGLKGPKMPRVTKSAPRSQGKR